MVWDKESLAELQKPEVAEFTYKGEVGYVRLMSGLDRAAFLSTLVQHFAEPPARILAPLAHDGYPARSSNDWYRYLGACTYSAPSAPRAPLKRSRQGAETK